MPTLEAEAAVDVSKDDAIDLRTGWDPEVVAALVQGVPEEVLADINADAAWGRPVSASTLDAGTSLERRQQLFQQDEAWLAGDWKQAEILHHSKLAVWSDGQAVGFSECVVLSTRVASETRQCRICFDTDGELFDACACRGSLRYICAECLLREWAMAKKKENDISSLSNLRCRLCHQAFEGPAAGLLGRNLNSAVEESARKRPDREPPEKAAERHTAEVAAATALWRQANHKDAAELFRKAITGLARIRGPDHATTLTAQHNLSLVLFALGQYEEAETRVRVAQAGFVKLFGQEHPLTLKAGHNVAMVVQQRGDMQQAIKLYSETLEARKRVLGPEHIDSLKTAVNLGLSLMRQGDSSGAEKQLRAAIGPLERVAGRKHPLTLTALQNLSITLIATNPKSDEAKVLAKEVCEGRHLALGEDHPETLEGLRDWFSVLSAAEDFEQAEEVGRRALSGMERVLGFNHPTTQQMVRKLKEALERQGREEAAAELAREHEAGNVQQVPKAPEPKPRGPTIAVVLSIFIAPDYRRKGLGKAVMQHWKTFSARYEVGATALELRISATSPFLPFFTEGVGMVAVTDDRDKPAGISHLRWSH